MSAKYLWVLIIAIQGAATGAATTPYFENFDGYALGDTPVADFTELSTADWTIVSPSISGQGYQNAIGQTVPGPGWAAGQASSSAIDLPSLASSAFSISTTFRIDSLTTTSVDPSGFAYIGLAARAADGIYASTGADRYQVSYYLDGATGFPPIPAGKLYLTEKHLGFGDGLVGTLSTGTLAIVLGDTYSLTLTGTPSGGSLDVSATLTDLTTSGSISVAETDSGTILGGSFFGYLDSVRVQDGGTTAINVDFDNFSASVPADSIPPSLSIAGAGGSLVQVTWTTNSVGYQLEQSTNLTVSAWAVVTNVPAVTGDHFVLMMDSSDTQRFFRLRK
jgi:hypothetical protein